MRNDGPSKPEDTGEVDIEDCLPRLIGDLMQKIPETADGGVVDEHVEFSERPHRLFDGRPDMGLIGHGTGDCQHLAAARHNRLRHRLQDLFTATRDRDHRSRFCEQFGRRFADPRAAACNENDLSVQLHSITSSTSPGSPEDSTAAHGPKPGPTLRATVRKPQIAIPHWKLAGSFRNR